MLDIVIGRNRNVFGVAEIRATLEELDATGTLYLGYPIIATADEPVVVEALLTCREFGIVVFDLHGARQGLSMSEIVDHQNDLHTALSLKLLAFRPLRSGRSLSVSVGVVSLVPTEDLVEGPLSADDETIVATPEQLREVLDRFDPITDEQLRLVNAAIQRITTIKPANKRTTVRKANSRGATMQKIEAEVANLDQWQKRAAIETPDGPQRIRGLAGSGKTVVLALKAAYLHAQNPEWDIAVTFSTRSLRQQFEDLIRRFCFEHMNDEPDWSKLRILHSWGSARTPGMYSEIAMHNGLSYHDFNSAKLAFGYDGAFGGACIELLAALKGRAHPRQLFDAVLIDEAQDLPQAFFELCFRATREPKRVVYAYDELQNIGTGTYTVPGPQVLFGSDAEGRPNVPNFHNLAGEARREIMLPVCYRNTPWALTTAHAVGFGIYKPGGLIQYFDDPQLWSDVGYDIVDGELELGQHVVLSRRPDSYPEYFNTLLDRNDAIYSKVFESTLEQARWVTEQIAQNLEEEELDLRDILIILTNPLTAREEAATVIEALSAHNIPAHLAGVTTSVDRLFQDDSVAISGIYRAKGNEAPMVYILNSEYGIGSGGAEAIRRRNILFTAITRSRAWVRVLGVGDMMRNLEAEIDSIRNRQFNLNFTVPTAQQLERMRKIQRDISRRASATIEKAGKSIEELVRLIETGNIDLETLPPELTGMLDRLRGDVGG